MKVSKVYQTLCTTILTICFFSGSAFADQESTEKESSDQTKAAQCLNYLSAADCKPKRAVFVDENARVGIKTTTPKARLDVAGSIAVKGTRIIDGTGKWIGDPTGLKGDKGDKGDPGPQGPAGPQGPQGPEGPVGPQGPEGPLGPEGPQGAEGPQGPQGAEGAQGPQGPVGPQGPEGPQGPQGPEGPEGPQGPQGPKGDKGDKGDPGGTSWIDGSGKVTTSVNVGIGTTNPGAALDVNGNIRIANNRSIAGNSGNNIGYLNIARVGPGNELFIGHGNNSRMHLVTGGTGGKTSLYIGNGGNVGIGTTTPGAELEVNGNIRIPNNKSIAGNSGNNIGYLNIARVGPGNELFIGHGNNSRMHLVTGGTGGKTSLYIGNGGNVGIGTTTPGAKLEVNGNLRIPNNMSIAGNSGNNIGYLNIARVGPGNELFIGHGNNSRMHLVTGGTGGRTSLYIANGGNVGIGTTSPKGRLDVNGAIYQRGRALHSDYVFTPGYKMESIEEHTEFMWREKHLKAVPKAKKDKDGSDIIEYGSHMKGVLEELEKAHIYISQLNEAIKKQQETIARLSNEIKMLKKK